MERQCIDAQKNKKWFISIISGNVLERLGNLILITISNGACLKERIINGWKMPEDNFIGKINPYIAAAAAIGNPGLQWLANVKGRKFSREMYSRQRQDALADWAMQNEYNSPRAQMQRFQEAGLNPNLIYGQQTESPSVRSSSASGANSQALQISNRDITGSLMAGYDMSRTSAQTDLLGKQMTLLEEDIKLRQVQQAATIAGTGKTSAEIQRIMFDLGLSQELKGTTIEGKQAEVKKLVEETKKIVIEAAQLMLTNPLKAQEMVIDILQKRKNLVKTDAEIAEINSKINLARQELTIKGFDEELVERGINPKDPGVIRVIQEKISKLLDWRPSGDKSGSLPGVGQGLKNWKKNK